MVEPNTESDPAAILIQFLVSFGALVGRGPHYRVEGDEHHVNLFALMVGATAKGRKGTSWSRVREVFEGISDWNRTRADCHPLFVAVKRSKRLPFGGERADEDEVEGFSIRFAELARSARTKHRIGMTPDARTVWEAVYPDLSEGGDGLHGAVTARAEAQVIRLALVYCLLDGAEEIDAPHLLAGLAVWQYCDDTAKHVFGASLGDRTADEIMRRLLGAGDAGVTRTEIRDVFGRNLSADRIGAALDLLRRKGRATYEMQSTGGRPTEPWKAAR